MKKTIVYKGKNSKVKELTYKDNPVKGENNSNIDFRYQENGQIHRRRKIDETGTVKKDYDFMYEPINDDHVHDWSNGGRNHRRNPNNKENVEIKKAKNKRRWFVWKK